MVDKTLALMLDTAVVLSSWRSTVIVKSNAAQDCHLRSHAELALDQSVHLLRFKDKILTPAVPYWKILSAGLGYLADAAVMASLKAIS